jgi:hypothetical protein
MKAGTLVRITKRSESAWPSVRAGEWGSYIPGAWTQSTSLPVDYEIIGFLLDPIEQGKSVRVLRIARNGEEILGIYQSTTVIEVRSDGYGTRNSVYCVEVVIPSNP